VRCLVVADLHYSLPQFDWLNQRAEEFEVLIIAGDLLDVASSAPRAVQIIAVLKYLKRIVPRTRLIVASGNHDLDLTSSKGEHLVEWLDYARRNGVFVDCDSMLYQDCRFTICPWWDGPGMKRRVKELIETDAARKPACWIWVHHSPPASSPVSWTRTAQAGDRQLVELIRQHQPNIVLTGHIHQAPFYAPQGSWKDRIGRSWVFNAGRQPGPIPTHIILDLTSRIAEWHSSEGIEHLTLKDS